MTRADYEDEMHAWPPIPGFTANDLPGVVYRGPEMEEHLRRQVLIDGQRVGVLAYQSITVTVRLEDGALYETRMYGWRNQDAHPNERLRTFAAAAEFLIETANRV